MEVTTWTEALWCTRDALGVSATMQAGTRVNAEQASKTAMRKPTLSFIGGRPTAVWEVNDTSTRLYPPGYWHWHAWKMKEVATREAQWVIMHRSNRQPARDRLGLLGSGWVRSTAKAG